MKRLEVQEYLSSDTVISYVKLFEDTAEITIGSGYIMVRDSKQVALIKDTVEGITLLDVEDEDGPQFDCGGKCQRHCGDCATRDSQMADDDDDEVETPFIGEDHES